MVELTIFPCQGKIVEDEICSCKQTTRNINEIISSITVMFIAVKIYKMPAETKVSWSGMRFDKLQYM